jgi:small multidrug resistance pump
MDSWIYLLFAILFGVFGTISMKMSRGLRKWQPSIFMLMAYSISFVALTMAIKSIDIGIVYAVWSGVGTILVAIVGVIMFGESISIKKIISLCLIVLGVIGIHLTNVGPTFTY